MLIGTFDVHMTPPPTAPKKPRDVDPGLGHPAAGGRVAGVMGMNFQVEFFEDPNTFWVVVAAMILFALTTLIVARRRDWL